LYKNLSLSDSKDKPLTKTVRGLLDRSRQEVTDLNIIPIGIVNVDGILLTKEQVSDNLKAKSENKVANSDTYENLEFISASTLDWELFQGNIQFKISPDFELSNINNPIKELEIDFKDGKGWQKYDYKEQLIQHQFTKIGETSIGIKVISKRGTYVTNCPLKVHFLIRPVPSLINSVTAPKIKNDIVKAGKVSESVAGADYAIYLGCDGLLDKPIIIAEGFDALGNVSLTDIVTKYFPHMQMFFNNGYDFIFVKYHNPRDYISNNAQVLKRVINDINGKKVGNNKMAVIGESMSGLVARWALREMENQGQNHNVDKFIAFDSPHKGANVPPGMVAMRLAAWDALETSIVVAIFNAFNPIIQVINAPAAEELLLFQRDVGGDIQKGIRFDIFRQELANLGNGGYPAQCKNIAFLNGALSGRQNTNFAGGDINPGDKIFDLEWNSNGGIAICYAFLDCWTNRINQDTKVYDGDLWGLIPILCPFSFRSRNKTLPYNLDRTAGGVIGIGTQNTNGFVTPARFSFVPTFSAIDYKGALNNDADYHINIGSWLDVSHQVNPNSQNLTPFKAIYGDNFNDDHSYIRNEGNTIRDLAIHEFGIPLANFNNGCIGCTAGSGGLAGSYYFGTNLQNQYPNTSSTEAVNYSSDEGRFTVLGGFTNVSARWQGSFEAPLTATYNFNLRTDDGSRLWFDGVQKVDDWGNYPPKDHTFQVALNAGDRKNIRIDWFQGGGGYEAKFMWSFNGVQSIVPACRLFATAAPVVDCNFAVTSSSNPATTTCGGTSSLSAGCIGVGCGGVSYAWSGNGGSYNGSPVTVTLPNANGAVGYTLTATKPGCANKTNVATITVGGCNSGTTLTPNNCYTIQSKINGQYMQAMGDNSIQKQGANNASNQLWKAVASGNSFQFLSQSNQQPIKCDNYNFGHHLSVGSGGNNLWNLETNNSSFRVSSPNNITWDMEGAGGGAFLQLYGTTTEPFADYRLWNFTQAACTSTNPPTGGGTTLCNTGNFNGNVDAMNCNQIAGWCFDNGNLSRTVKVDIFSDGQLVTTVDANQNRPDLGTAFNNNAAIPHGFSYAVPNNACWKNGANHVITVKPCGGTANISNGSANLSCTGTGSGTCGTTTTTGGGTTGTGTTGTTGVNCPTPTVGNPVVFHWDVASQSVWFAHLGPTGQMYASYDANPSSPAFTHTQLANSGVPSTKIPCFLNGVKQSRVANSVDDNSGVEVYPNPTNGKIKVGFSLSQDENVWINLYDNQGRSLQIRDFEGKSGKNLIELDLQDYPSGAYFIDLQSSQKREVEKVMKVN
jgi:PA14 domain/Secretion system C-terminal sorting domain/Putative serine esterase (DUF676)